MLTKEVDPFSIIIAFIVRFTMESVCPDRKFSILILSFTLESPANNIEGPN